MRDYDKDRRHESAGNFRFVARVMGVLLLIEALLLMIPCAVSLGYGETEFVNFLITSGATAAVGGILVLCNRKSSATRLYRREGYLLTALAWVMFSAFGMIPYMLDHHPLSAASAYFETMSGFTTTGASMITDVESCSHGLLLWRALTQWVGGLGIVLFMLAMLPSLNKEGSLPMFNAEITGVTHDKIHPRIRQTAASLWKVYTSLTLLLILLLWIGPMDLFDAVCQGLSTLSTGGFSTRNAGIAAWNSQYVAIVMTVFMFAGGVNFILIYNTAKGGIRRMWDNDVFRTYTYTILACAACILLSIAATEGWAAVGSNIIQTFFTVISGLTSTGFSYGDYELWGSAVFSLLLAMMMIGACAGSTTGGFKIDRAIISWKEMRLQCRRTIYPNHIESVRLNGKPVAEATIPRIGAFALLWALLLALGTVVLSLYGISFSDALFATTSCMGNCGLGYGLTGSSGGFFELPDAPKWLLSAIMLTGRLEIFTVMALLFRGFWRR